ncbi:flagellin [Pectinatus cerevisiiphilus]|uniref:Flagellin n=1 Tax=Pectinatus cerevisiiphilus TaxID=86956 RepID=A0A4R3K1U4_9FIRM|nr:flagellin [Pectinatus cerevisiiphilus]TCS75809.1 flagellin [Pectinatus cerevisiiphilus]
MGIFTSGICEALGIGDILSKNVKSKNKAAAHLASGEKINSAGDNPAPYAISEKMRVLIRSLNQDTKNVKTGMSMLQTAAGGIQIQIDLLRKIKERVLAASNDTSSSDDRKIIQDEINQYYSQIQDISTDTNYNNISLLDGNSFGKKVIDWSVLKSPVLLKGSDELGLVPNTYSSLDKTTGPFDTFSEYTTKAASIPDLGIDPALTLAGGSDGIPKEVALDINSATPPYTSVSSLDGAGFRLSSTYGTRSYVLTMNPAKQYPAGAYTVDISSCNTLNDVAKKISEVSFYGATAQVTPPSMAVTFTSTEKSADSNVLNVSDWQSSAFTSVTTKRDASPATSLFKSDTYFTGGTNSSGRTDDVDDPYKPGTSASLSKDISSAANGTGITVYGNYGNTYIQFTDGNDMSYDSVNSIYKVGKEYSGHFNRNSITFDFNKGKMQLTADYTGSYGNSCKVSDGIPARPDSSISYEAVSPLRGEISTLVMGSDGDLAHADVDLSAYNKSDTTALEDFIKNVAGKAISKFGYSYQFIDSKATSLAGISTISSASSLDLNELRSSVAGGETITEAFVNFLQKHMGSNSIQPIIDDEKTIGLSFLASVKGKAGNGTQIQAFEGVPRSYALDFKSWLSKDSVQEEIQKVGSLVDFLDGRGFRAYCATCNDQWFNFSFINGTNSDRPQSGTPSYDIKTIPIDISSVTDAGSLAMAIYEQSKPILTGTDPYFNHFMRIAADKDSGVLTLYDKRFYSVSSYPNYQEEGAKIADGVFDNVVRDERNLLVKKIVIQHTDKSSMNIVVDIPKTSLDQLFNCSEQELAEYTVLTRESREKLLGTTKTNTGGETEGKIDKGIRYLTDAANILGAQIDHLMSASDNIVTENENTTASESSMRDTDMAKGIADYIKDSILEQTGQYALLYTHSLSASSLSLLGNSANNK